MSSTLYDYHNYTVPINYIAGYIREYDIKKANISILYKKNIISKEDYIRLYNADRMTRQIEIGLLQQRDPLVTDVLKKGILEAKKNFFETNNIEDDKILSIKNDAVFLLNYIPAITSFDNGIVKFNLKNTYTSFYKLLNKEYYYYFDPVRKYEQLDIKGINDECLKLHENYFLEFLQTIFHSAQTEPVEETIDLLKIFYKKYINRELDIGYYRRFDGESGYQFLPMSNYSSFRAKDLPQDYVKYLDISYNLQILTELVKIYSGNHFQTITRKVTY